MSTTTTIQLPQNPKWGYDPWPGPGAPPVALVDGTWSTIPAPEGTTIFTGADTIGGDIGLLPAGLDMYGSYIDNFGGYMQLVARFGKTAAFLLSITIFGGKARCADVEPGAMHPTDLPHWLDSVGLHDSLSPSWVYTNAANMGACNAHIGSRKVIRWSAHYGHGPHICGPATCGFAQADWTQWADKGASGQNIDRSVGRVLPVTKPKPPQPAPKPAGGIWAFEGTYDPKSNHFTITGAPGQSVVFAEKPTTAQATITVNLHTGAWTIHHE